MKHKKIISIILSLIMMLSSITPTFADFSDTESKTLIDKQKAHQLKIANRINDALMELGMNANSDEEAELLVISQLESDITNKLYKAGALKVERFVEGAYKVRINSQQAYKLSNISDIVSVGINHQITLDPPKREPILLPNLEYSNEDTTIKDLWAAGYDGKNTVVAIIDTGVEPSHEILKLTADGRLKITDHQDFNHAGLFDDYPSEGDVKLTEITVGSTSLKIPYQYLEYDAVKGQNIVKDGLMTVTVPAELIGKTILSGVFSEHKMIKEDGEMFDTNNNGIGDRFPLICVDNDNNGTYEEMYFDTDIDLSVADEKPIGVYKDVASKLADKVIFQMNDNGPVLDQNSEPIVLEEYKKDYNMLFNTIENKITDSQNIRSKTRFNFVCTRIDKETFDSWYANISYDSRGHGTHVAGDAAASGYLEHEFVNKELEASGKLIGPAPNAQIMDLKVFRTTSGTSEDLYIRAMQYAAINGADVANLSLGNLPEITDGSSMGAAYADLLTIKYGTIYVFSNGNSGPGINSNGSPGDTWFGITVGAYCPSFYVVGSRYKNAEDQMWIFSSNGPADDGRIKPDIVAPGSMISASPMWDIIGKGYTEYSTFKEMEDSGKLYIGYAREQGTSMASPYAAGVAAALMQAVKKENLKYHPLLFKDALKKSANKALNGGKYNPLEIGGGMIDPIKALTELRVMNNSTMLQKLTTGENPPLQWPYNYDDRQMRYIGFNDMYIYANVLFKNDDRMKYANAAGLFVRDKDIPDEVTIELENNTKRNASLTIKKVAYGSGQNTDWLTVQNSIAIETGKKKAFKIMIDSTKLTTGVNVMLIELDDPNTYQLDCVIPVSVIKADKLDFSKPNILQSSNTKPGAYSRQFVKIDKDTDRFRITVEVPEGTKGRVRPFIYFPNGTPYTWDNINDYAGSQSAAEIAKGKPAFVPKIEVVITRADLERASMDYQNPNPNRAWKWEGTWEIDTYCSYASEQSVNSTLSVSTAEVLMNEKSMMLDMNAGDTFKGTLVTANTTGQDIKLKYHGFIDMSKNQVKERIERFGEFNTIERGFEIKQGEKNVFHRVVITNASYGVGARVWLYLYKAKLNPDGSYELIKPMINKFINVQENGMESEMITHNLEPGYYVYALFGGIMEHGPVDFDLITQTLNASDAVPDTLTTSGPQTIANGETATINFSLKAPTEKGRYIARITFEDSTGKILKAMPITANVAETKRVIEIKQSSITLLDDELTLAIDAAFPNDIANTENLYGVEFQLKYNPAALSAKDVLRGDVFTDSNSYLVKKEIVKDSQGKEVGVINFAYAFKGMATYGIAKGNIAKIKFISAKVGISEFEVNNLLVGNFEGNELTARVVKQNIITAHPDVNHDGVVDIKDYAYCAYSYGAIVEDVRYRKDADVNRDGVINDTDINYILKYFKNKF